MAKKRITPGQHIKNANKLSAQGQSAIFDYANKHGIKYEVCKPCDTESPAVNHICLVCGSPTKAKFTVPVCRTSYAFRDIEVLATNAKEAKKLALEEAGDHEYSEKDADYSAQEPFVK